MVTTSLTQGDDERVITRSRWSAVFKENRKITGFQYGKGDIVVRIYDKVTELLKPENSEKLLFFREKWGFFPESCTRIEFQLRRKALKEFNINTFSDALNSVDDLWNYLTTSWFRHTSVSVDRKNSHQTRAKDSFFWSIVQNFSSSKKISDRVVQISRHKSMKKLNAQLLGILTTISAGMGHESTDIFSLISTCQGLVRDQISKAFDRPDWKTFFNTRRNNTILIYDDFDSLPTPESIFFRGSVQGELFI